MDEELIRQAADLRRPSARLRRRGLAAAERGCRRRMMRQRILCVACPVLPVFGLGLWSRSLVNGSVTAASQSPVQLQVTHMPPDRAAAGYVSAEVLSNWRMLPDLYEWEFVESMMRLKQQHLQMIRGAFY